MLHRAAAAIREGGAELAVICGAEALASLRHYRRCNETPPWSHAAPAEWAPDLDKRRLPAEAAAGLTQGVGAVYGFAMRDVARRAHLGISPADYIAQLGTLTAGMTRVAAANPDAWFRLERSPDFLVTPRPDNRMIAYPYTKHMTAIIDVDIGAALVMTSEAMADRLGVPRTHRVYPWAGCFAQDPVYTAVRPDLWQSAAMRAASRAVLAAANITMDDVQHVDLYSCFPAAVNFARDALGITDRPGDRITVTGGLPYAGGPASSYVVTSLAKMSSVLRGDPGAKGLVSGLGKQMAHHAFGLYSTTPPPPSLGTIDEPAVQAELDRIPQIPVVDSYGGPGTVAAYTVMHDRTGAATHGAAICDLPDGSRTYALISDPGLLAEAEETELVGRSFHIEPDANGRIVGSLRPPRSRPGS